MKEIKGNRAVAKEIMSPEKEFRGYTIEEIRFQRALVALEADFCKTKIAKSWSNIQESNPFSPGKKSFLPTKAGSLAIRMFNGLNYLDYAFLGFSLFKGAKKVFSIFRGRKNK